MKNKKLWIIVIVIALVVWIYRDQWFEKAATKQAGTNTGDGLKQKVLSFSIDGHSPKGAKQWHLEGSQAEIKGEEIYLDELSGVTYAEEATINLTSRNGIYYKEKQEVELIGDVKVLSNDGVTLTTERAKWSQDTKEVVSKDNVKITRPGMTAVGEGGIANSDKKTAALNKDVVVKIEPNTKVKCDGPLDVYYDENKAVFYNNVMVEDKDGRLFADKLTVYYDPKKKELVQAISEGNVRIKRGNSYTLSDKAIYTGSTKTAQLLGRPRLIIDPVELDRLDSMKMEDIKK